MKNISNLQLEFLRRQVFVLVCVLIWPATSFAQMYQQKILVANAAGQGATTVDSSLVDPWGIARSTTSPWWVSDRATGVSTVYNAAGGKLLQVTIPNGSPTGVVFNGSTTDFLVTPGGTFAHFIFCVVNRHDLGMELGCSCSCGSSGIAQLGPHRRDHRSDRR